MASSISKLTPDLLQNVVFELKFDPSVISGVICGELWMCLKKWTPVDLVLPEGSSNYGLGGIQLRKSPQHFTGKFKNSNTVIGFDDSRIWFTYHNEYPGWQQFYNDITAATEYILSNLSFISFSRLGLRYINEIEGLIVNNNSAISLRIKDKSPISNLKISHTITKNNSTILINIQQHLQTSYLDIDVSKTFENLKKSSKIATHADSMHEIEKQWFCDLIPDEILSSRSVEP